MEEQLVALLLNAAGVTALVSDRIDWGKAPQSVSGHPYVVLQRIDGLHDYHMQGASGYVASRVQIDTYSEKYTATKKATRALIAALSGYKGGIFQGIFLDGERDLPAADAGEVTNLFRTSLDFMVHHKET
ncbi:tail completion protein gp17 [Mesorhizobium sp. A623]